LRHEHGAAAALLSLEKEPDLARWPTILHANNLAALSM
jgi:hypothetical protein